MLDPVVVLEAVAVSAAIAAVVPVACDHLERRAAERRGLRRAGWAIGCGCGAIAGMWVLGVRPTGRFAGDQERLAFLVLPLVAVVEALAAAGPVRRGVVAFAVGPILLFGSVYLAGAAAGPQAWRPMATAAVLGGVGAAVTAGLVAVTARAPRASYAVRACCLGLTTAAAGVITMLSGYLTGGQLAFPLAAVTLAACGMSWCVPLDAAVTSVGYVGLAGILIIGYFFGSLSAVHAIALLAIPAVCPVVERLPSPWLRSWQRAVLSAALTAALVAGVVWQARRRFDAALAPARPDATRPADVQDYLHYGR